MRVIAVTLVAGLMAVIQLTWPASETVAKGRDRPVVLELFTSQGCSSCPPADRLLSDLGRRDLEGVELIPLSFHVDYWNYLGWRDVFSRSAWSKRQRRYAEALGSGRVYTPQVVIQGEHDCVGSRESCVLQGIERARSRPGRARVEIDRLETSPESFSFRATVRAERLERSAEVIAVLYESGLLTEVSRGENARRALRNDFVVRALQELGNIEARESRTHRLRASIALDPQWKIENIGAAVLIQDQTSRLILVAKDVSPPDDRLKPR